MPWKVWCSHHLEGKQAQCEESACHYVLGFANAQSSLRLIDIVICPTSQATHLLKYDSILGTFNADVKVVDDSTLSVDGKNIQIVSSRDPLKLPWADLGIDIVIEVRTRDPFL